MGRRAGLLLRRLLTGLLAGLLGLVVVAVLGVTHPTPAVACSCAVDPTPNAVSLARAEVVFAGELVRIDRPVAGSSGADQQLRFEVRRVYKGEVSARTTVHTPRSSASCGLGIETTGPYVIFGRGGGGDVRANLCDGQLAGTTPPGFGAGREPTATHDGPWSATAPSPAARVVAVVGGLVVLGAAVVLLVRRRRRPGVG
jgi:hypothetical protein